MLVLAQGVKTSTRLVPLRRLLVVLNVSDQTLGVHAGSDGVIKVQVVVESTLSQGRSWNPVAQQAEPEADRGDANQHHGYDDSRVTAGGLWLAQGRWGRWR